MGHIKQVDGITLRVSERGAVLWCDDWSALLQTALRGHTSVKLRHRGEVIWVV
jgi:hypothetical protein